jgi:hypothetical protein
METAEALESELDAAFAASGPVSLDIVPESEVSEPPPGHSSLALNGQNPLEE